MTVYSFPCPVCHTNLSTRVDTCPVCKVYIVDKLPPQQERPAPERSGGMNTARATGPGLVPLIDVEQDVH